MGKGRRVREGRQGTDQVQSVRHAQATWNQFHWRLQLPYSSGFISLSISVFITKIPSAHTIFLMQPSPDHKSAKAEARRARARPWPAHPGKVSTASLSISVTSNPWKSCCLLVAAPDNWVQGFLPRNKRQERYNQIRGTNFQAQGILGI